MNPMKPSQEELTRRYVANVAEAERVPLTTVHMEVEAECGYDAIFGEPWES